jgi:hypothetical protein
MKIPCGGQVGGVFVVEVDETLEGRSNRKATIHGLYGPRNFSPLK